LSSLTARSTAISGGIGVAASLLVQRFALSLLVGASTSDGLKSAIYVAHKAITLTLAGKSFSENGLQRDQPAL
jgi:hypothetical protein